MENMIDCNANSLNNQKVTNYLRAKNMTKTFRFITLILCAGKVITRADQTSAMSNLKCQIYLKYIFLNHIQHAIILKYCFVFFSLHFGLELKHIWRFLSFTYSQILFVYLFIVHAIVLPVFCIIISINRQANASVSENIEKAIAGLLMSNSLVHCCWLCHHWKVFQEIQRPNIG